VGNRVTRTQAPLEANETSDFITLARVVKTQGRHGEVAAEIHSTVSDRFAEGMQLFALPPGAENRRELQLENLWPHKDWLVLKFQGVDSITDAEALVGCELQVPRSQRAQLDAGWNYVSDLVGCTVFDQGREIGRIADVQFGAGEAPLLVVADEAGKKLDVPFAEAYLEKVDAQHREVRMHLPEGLLEVNAPLTQEEKREQTPPDRKESAGSAKIKDSRRPLRARR
jgi:16S rRNA processing protein RimM